MKVKTTAFENIFAYEQSSLTCRLGSTGSKLGGLLLLSSPAALLLSRWGTAPMRWSKQQLSHVVSHHHTARRSGSWVTPGQRRGAATGKPHGRTYPRGLPAAAHSQHRHLAIALPVLYQGTRSKDVDFIIISFVPSNAQVLLVHIRMSFFSLTLDAENTKHDE